MIYGASPVQGGDGTTEYEEEHKTFPVWDTTNNGTKQKSLDQ